MDRVGERHKGSNRGQRSDRGCPGSSGRQASSPESRRERREASAAKVQEISMRFSCSCNFCSGLAWASEGPSNTGTTFCRLGKHTGLVCQQSPLMLSVYNLFHLCLVIFQSQPVCLFQFPTSYDLVFCSVPFSYEYNFQKRLNKKTRQRYTHCPLLGTPVPSYRYLISHSYGCSAVD